MQSDRLLCLITCQEISNVKAWRVFTVNRGIFLCPNLSSCQPDSFRPFQQSLTFIVTESAILIKLLYQFLFPKIYWKPTYSILILVQVISPRRWMVSSAATTVCSMWSRPCTGFNRTLPHSEDRQPTWRFLDTDTALPWHTYLHYRPWLKVSSKEW